MRGDNGQRRAEDIGGQELSYAEVKAIASGNPAVLTLAEADAELQRLSVLKKNHTDEQYVARRNVRDLPQTIDRLSQRLAGLTADQKTLASHAGLTIAGHAIGDSMAALGNHLGSLPQHVTQDRRVPLGTFRGLQFGIILHAEWRPEVYLQGRTTRLDTLSRDHQGPRAVLNALERIAGGYQAEAQRTRQDLAIADSQLRDYQARIGQPFAHADYFDRLAGLRDQLKAGLAGVTPEAGAEPVNTPEIAEQIKALKASHTIEAAPQRAARHRASAEEPVTARIRRRAEVNYASADEQSKSRFVGRLTQDRIAAHAERSPA
jgi:hypothetical protein